MKKILIFGCSFTQGSYTIASKEFIPRENWIASDKIIRGSYGWWYFVDYFKDKDVTIITCPSQGYWAYYQILLYLSGATIGEEQDKLEYDEIWIQETIEPRANINNYKDISSLFTLQQGHIINETFKIFFINDAQILNLNPWNCNKEHEPYTLWTSFFNEITKLCARNIDNLCAEKNIKGYVWSMYNSIMKCEHFTRLPLQDMRKKLKEKNLLVPGDHGGLHQTEEGNKYIGKLINEALCIDTKT